MLQTRLTCWPSWIPGVALCLGSPTAQRCCCLSNLPAHVEQTKRVLRCSRDSVVASVGLVKQLINLISHHAQDKLCSLRVSASAHSSRRLVAKVTLCRLHFLDGCSAQCHYCLLAGEHRHRSELLCACRRHGLVTEEINAMTHQNMARYLAWCESRSS